MLATKNKFFDIIFYIYYEDLNVLSPYLYAIKMWRECGYNVSVFSLHDEKLRVSIPERTGKDFVHHSVKFPFFLKVLCKLILAIGSIPRIAGLRTRGGTYVSFVKKSYFAFYCYFKTDKSKKTILIAVDPPSLWAAALVSKRTKNPYIYFVKEIFLSDDIKTTVKRFTKFLERKANRNALFTVEFDETRAELLRKDNQLAPGSIMVVPNAPPGKADIKKEQYWHDKFKIKKEKKIVLYTGGIADYNLTYEIISTIETWPENVVLVMHCLAIKEAIEELINFAYRFKGEIYFSTDIVPFSEINKLYASCDIGFAMYGNHDLNHKYTGMSSGKLFNFMKACVPIITNDTPSCKKAVEETGCGVCVNNISKIGSAIKKILKNEENYRSNCLKTFSSFSFDRNYKKLMEAIENHWYMRS